MNPNAPTEAIGVAETLPGHTGDLGTTVPRSAAVPLTQGGRTTVLPRRESADAAPTASGAGRRFHHVKPLGEGGMGEVMLALDQDIQRRVAIKRMRGGAQSEAMLHRFADEVRIIGQLEHPSIVPVHDVGVDDDGQLYLVMKYVAGDTLETVIDKLRAGDPAFAARFPISKRVEVFARILEALSYAHEKGFVHRDLKPANVMVGPHGEVTLMDWGIAKQIGTSDAAVDALGRTDDRSSGRLVETQAGAILGTPLYMSPEQAAGKNADLDARSDVFAAGLLATELFTLEHPLGDLDSASAVFSTLIHEDINSPGKFGKRFIATDAPAELMWFLVRALARDRDQRFPDAGVMLERLRAVQAGDIPIQCPVSLTKRATNGFLHWVDRHPLLWSLLLVLGTISALGGIVSGVIALVHALH